MRELLRKQCHNHISYARSSMVRMQYGIHTARHSHGILWWWYMKIEPMSLSVGVGGGRGIIARKKQGEREIREKKKKRKKPFSSSTLSLQYITLSLSFQLFLDRPCFPFHIRAFLCCSVYGYCSIICRYTSTTHSSFSSVLYLLLPRSPHPPPSISLWQIL